MHSRAQEDYRVYHRWINNAERCFFLESKVDSAYQYYDLAFSTFDFVFAKGCFMAAQIAYYNHNEKYIAYLEKGFKAGLGPQHLKLSAILAPLAKDSISFAKKFRNYPALHKAYLKKINVNILRTVIKMNALDQSQKRLPARQYTPMLHNTLFAVDAIIKSVGFPGEKLIGLTQPGIMHELGYEGQDYKYFPWGHTFDGEYEYIAQTDILSILIHGRCTYQMFSKYWDKLISLGQVHPTNVAMLYDGAYSFYSDRYTTAQQKEWADIYKCYYDHPPGCYKKNAFVDYSSCKCNRHDIDSMRTALYINTLAVDSAITIFSQKHLFKTFFGFFSNAND